MKNCKRIIGIICLLILTMGLVACGNSEKVEKDENGNVIKKTVYSDGELLYIHTYEYDENGKQIVFKEYDSSNVLDFYSETQYNSLGQQTKKIIHLDHSGNQESYILYEYWPNGSEKNVTEYYSNDSIKELQEYSEDGTRISWNNYYKSGDWEESIFDEKGNKTEEVYYYSSGGKIVKKYDLNGKRTLESTYDADGNLVTEKAY